MTATLSTQTILALANALASLNGYQDTVTEGEKSQAVHRPYKFSAATHAAIARNLAKCSAVADAYNRTKAGLIMQISGGRTEVTPPPVSEKDKPGYHEKVEAYADQVDAFNKVNQLFMAELHALDLVMIDEKELKLDANPIPFNVLAMMAPMLEGWETPEGIAFTTPLPPAPHPLTWIDAEPLANGHADVTPAA